MSHNPYPQQWGRNQFTGATPSHWATHRPYNGAYDDHIRRDQKVRPFYLIGYFDGFIEGINVGYERACQEAMEKMASMHPQIKQSVANFFDGTGFNGEPAARAQQLTHYLKTGPDRPLDPKCDCDDWARGYEYRERQTRPSHGDDVEGGK